MARSDLIKADAIIQEALPNGYFKVKLTDRNHEVLTHLSGKLRMHLIRLVPGDKVEIEMTPYDLTRGRITYRK